MKNLNKKLGLAISVLFSTIFLTGTSYAAETNMAVLNYQVVLFNSIAAEEATVQLRKSLEPAQQRLNDIQSGLSSRQSRLQTDADILTEEEVLIFQQEIQSFLAEQAQISSQMQQAQQQSRTQFVQTFQPVVREIVQSIVVELGFTLVIDSQAVLWNEGTEDLTEQVLNQFDLQYSKSQSSQEVTTSE